MGKIWLKSTDPNKQCCGCEGKSGPCDSCCPLISIPTGQNAYPSGVYANKLRYVPESGIDVTDGCFVFSNGDSTLTISNPDTFVGASTSKCFYPGLTQSNGAYTVLFTLGVNERLNVTRIVLNNTSYEAGSLYFDPANPFDGSRCTPRPGVTPGIIGSYREIDTVANAILTTDQFFVTGISGNVTRKQYLLQTVNAGSSAPKSQNQGYTVTQTQSVDGTCTNVTGAAFNPGATYSYGNILSSGVVNSSNDPRGSSFNGTRITFEASNTVVETTYTNRAPCTPIPLTSNPPWAIGTSVSNTIKITGILQTEGPVGRAATALKSVTTACVEMSMKNLNSIQLLSPSGTPLPLKPRLRAFKVVG